MLTNCVKETDTSLLLQERKYYTEPAHYAKELQQWVHVYTEELTACAPSDPVESEEIYALCHTVRNAVTNVSLYLRLIEQLPEKQSTYAPVVSKHLSRLRQLVVQA